MTLSLQTKLLLKSRVKGAILSLSGANVDDTRERRFGFTKVLFERVFTDRGNVNRKHNENVIHPDMV